MDRNQFNPDGTSLEDAFFAAENRRLLQRLREQSAKEERRAALKAALPHSDDAFVDKLLELGIRPETALAVVLVPLTRVAWADGKIDAKEKDAILRAAEERGVKAGTPARELLESWLVRQPGDDVVSAWKQYVHNLGAALSADEKVRTREQLLTMARGVAEAAGGILGMAKVSAAERAVLEDMERSLSA